MGGTKLKVGRTLASGSKTSINAPTRMATLLGRMVRWQGSPSFVRGESLSVTGLPAVVRLMDLHEELPEDLDVGLGTKVGEQGRLDSLPKTVLSALRLIDKPLYKSNCKSGISVAMKFHRCH